jgi:hypothetical protein
MTPRHAGALALVVWYLMFPPIDPSSRFDPTVTTQQLDLKAPLHEWWIGDTFSTFDQCKAAVASMKLKRGNFWFGKDQCFSSEDSRLQDRHLNFVPDAK